MFLILILSSAFLRAQDPLTIERSLHYTRAGADYWYCAENGGFELITGMKISKDCVKCHPENNAAGNRIIHEKYKPGCTDCHVKSGSKEVNLQSCLDCHTYQAAEIGIAEDVHRLKGMTCIDCHTAKDMHGDGSVPLSIYDGVIENKCESCHKNISQSQSHTVHENLDCSACHVSTQIACFNCHFESGKINTGMKDYILLAKNTLTQKIQAVNYMGLSFGDRTFLAISPYKAHTITREGRKCGDCHANYNVQYYMKNKKIALTWWDERSGMLNNAKGVIPVPPDWQKSITADFAGFDPSLNKNRGWFLLKRGIDRKQMLFLEPLDDAAMKKLAEKMK